MLDFLNEHNVILFSAIVFQAIGGMGNGMVIPGAMAILTSYKDKSQIYIGYIELCLSLSAIFGPVLGAGMYMIFGFMGPFAGVGILFLCYFIYSWNRKKHMTFKQDQLDSQYSSFIENSPELSLKDLSFVEIMSIPRSLMGHLG